MMCTQLWETCYASQLGMPDFPISFVVYNIHKLYFKGDQPDNFAISKGIFLFWLLLSYILTNFAEPTFLTFSIPFDWLFLWRLNYEKDKGEILFSLIWYNVPFQSCVSNHIETRKSVLYLLLYGIPEFGYFCSHWLEIEGVYI